MSKAALVYLGLGSNVDAEVNLALGIRELRREYGEVELSAVYRNAAVGFDGDDFLNLVAGFRSDRPAAILCEHIELIHNLADGVAAARSGKHARSTLICCFTMTK